MACSLAQLDCWFLTNQKETGFWAQRRLGLQVRVQVDVVEDLRLGTKDQDRFKHLFIFVLRAWVLCWSIHCLFTANMPGAP